MGESGDEKGMPTAVEEALEAVEIERAVLNESDEGRRIAADFIAAFGAYVSGEVRPILRQVAADGGEPQLLVNGLAELMRQVADSIEFPIGSPR